MIIWSKFGSLVHEKQDKVCEVVGFVENKVKYSSISVHDSIHLWTYIVPLSVLYSQ